MKLTPHLNGNGTATAKIDVVFIRKSTEQQAEEGQRQNVEGMLKALSVYVPDANWFSGTVSRRKVRNNPEFNRMMELVDAGRVRTVYVESQDRWGGRDRPELFTLLGILREHGTRLYDLRAGMDLTERDLATELLAFINSVKSEKELQDIAYRSLRTRVAQFQATGSWPTGTHPYGYGKECRGPDGTLRWVFQPINRGRGQIFNPGPDGLVPGPTNVKIPRKARGDLIKLVPSNNPDSVRAVRLIFDLYARVGLSRRQISARLNDEGLMYNGKPFSHPMVTQILFNPAYAGDTYFGKVQTGELFTFDTNALITEVKGKRDNPRRAAEECLIKRDTHEALVDRKTWELAQRKLVDEHVRTSHAPRNPAYYLKQLLVCGHCGKGMAARTESNPDTGKRTVVYLCSSYVASRCNGHTSDCGYQRITHVDAEKLLLDKIAELNLPFDLTASAGARANLEARLQRLGKDDEESLEQWTRWIGEGIDALAGYLIETYQAEYPALMKLRKMACYWYWTDLEGKPDTYRPFGDLTVCVADLKAAVQEAEHETTDKACKKLAELREEHKALTRSWAKATDEMQAVLKQDIEQLEAQIHEWEPRTVPLSERFKALYDAEAARQAEREQLLAEWPTLENREKGEALRRLFKTVKLFWTRKHHAPSAKPTRPRKTKRDGRYSYALNRDAIEWTLDSVGSW